MTYVIFTNISLVITRHSTHLAIRRAEKIVCLPGDISVLWKREHRLCLQRALCIACPSSTTYVFTLLCTQKTHSVLLKGTKHKYHLLSTTSSTSMISWWLLSSSPRPKGLLLVWPQINWKIKYGMIQQGQISFRWRKNGKHIADAAQQQGWNPAGKALSRICTLEMRKVP